MVRRLGSPGLFVGIALCLLFLSSGAVAAAPTTYTDPQGRFSFTVPDGYTTVDTSGFATIGYRSPTYTGANVLVSVGDSGGVTLDQFAAAALKAAGNVVKNFQPDPAGTQPATVAGYAAVMYGYTASLDTGLLRGQQYAFIVGSRAYAITLTARDADFAAFMREASVVLSSFTVGGSAGAGTATTPATTAPATVPATAGSPGGAPSATAPAAPAASPSRYFIRRLGDG